MYGKIFASLYQGTLRGKSDEILVFTNMIACCDKYGEVDKHPRAIADETGLSVERVNAAIATLEAPDPESRSRDHGGARIVRVSTDRTWGWAIVNYVKYRNIRDEESRREQNKLAAERYRVSKRQQASSPVITRHHPSAQAEAKAEGEAEADVDSRASASASGKSQEPDPSDICAQPTQAPIPTGILCLGDFETLYRALLIQRDERPRAAQVLTLYGQDAFDKACRTLCAEAKTRPRGKDRVFLDALHRWLEAHYELDSGDYRRAGLPVPDVSAP